MARRDAVLSQTYLCLGDRATLICLLTNTPEFFLAQMLLLFSLPEKKLGNLALEWVSISQSSGKRKFTFSHLLDRG